MDQRSLHLFLTLAHHLHFAKASEACHVSAPTLSRNIKQLEQEVGCELFERNKRSVKLTKQGHAFIKFAQSSLAQWQKFKDDLEQDTNTITGELSLFSSVTATYSFLYDLLKLIRKHHPGIEIQLNTGDPALAINRVMTGQEDLAIAARPDVLPSGLVFYALGFSPLVFIAPKEGEINQVIKANQVKNTALPWEQLPFIVPEQGLAKTRLATWWQENAVTPQIYAKVAGNEAAVSMVSLGFGVALVPQVVVDNSPIKHHVDILTTEHTVAPFEVGLVVQKSRLKKLQVSAVWQLLSELD